MLQEEERLAKEHAKSIDRGSIWKEHSNFHQL